MVRSRSIFCLVNETSLNCTSGLVLLFLQFKELEIVVGRCVFFKDVITHFSMTLVFQNGINR